MYSPYLKRGFSKDIIVVFLATPLLFKTLFQISVAAGPKFRENVSLNLCFGRRRGEKTDGDMFTDPILQIFLDSRQKIFCTFD